MMERIKAAEAEQSLGRIMDRVCASGVPVVISRRGKKSVVMLPLRDYEGLNETLHLLSSPRNAERLLRAIASADQSQ